MSLKYNNLLTGTDVQFNHLLSKYSICPPSQIGNHRGVNVQKPDPLNALNTVTREVGVGHGAADPILAGSTRSTDIRIAKIDKTKKIAYVDLEKWPRGQAAGMNRGQEGGNTIYLDAAYLATPNYIPVWYLPWDDGGASIRITLPAKGTGGAVDPDIFFTAAINGCSIFFQGTTRNPTIYHCGGPTGYKSDEQDDSAEFWQAVVTEFVLGDAANKSKGRVSGSSVDKRDYVSNATTITKDAQGQKMFSTPRAMEYHRQLAKNKASSRLHIEEVSPWGCVLGRRDAAGDWTFYLQENCTITYHQVSKNLLKRMGNKGVVTTVVSRPMTYTEIFPAGGAHAIVQPPLRRIT